MCYFPILDIYTKIWLWLAFSSLCHSSCGFGYSLSAPTLPNFQTSSERRIQWQLATLILLSYAKLLKICFKSLTVGILQYPDKNSSERLWLPDASMKHLWKAYSFIHCSCSHSRGWSGLHCFFLYVAVAPSPYNVRNFKLVKDRIQRYKLSPKPTTHLTLQALLLDLTFANYSYCLVPSKPPTT